MEFRYNEMSCKGGVYKITNITSGKGYIGSAKRFKERAYQHLHTLEKGKHFNKHLQAAFILYGTDAFVFEILEVVEGDKLARTTTEQGHLNMFLDKWDQLYNDSKNVVQTQGPWSSTPEETRKKISEASSNRKHSEKTKAKIGKASKCNKHNIGSKRSVETRIKMSVAQLGKKHPHSAEAKMKISKTLKGNTYSLGYKHSEETKRKMSESHKGCNHGYKLGQVAWNKGKPHSEETKRKISIAKKKARLSGL